MIELMNVEENKKANAKLKIRSSPKEEFGGGKEDFEEHIIQEEDDEINSQIEREYKKQEYNSG